MASKQADCVALFPDRIAHYRVAVFEALAHMLEQDRLALVVHTGREPSDRSIPSLTGAVQSEGPAFRVVPGFEFSMRGIVFWQSGMLRTILDPHTRLVVAWGEAHRLSTWLGLLASRLTGTPLLLWGHGLYGREGAFKRTLRLLFYRCADHLMLYGDHGRRELLARGLPDAHMTVVNNGLDASAIATARERATRTTPLPEREDWRLLYVGRLISDKRVELLIRAAAELRARGRHGLRVRIVGDGPERPTLEAEVRRLDLADVVEFAGAVYDEEPLAEEFRAASVSISPGNVGLLAVHALAYGCPVITHADPAWQMPEAEAVVEGETGALFERGSPASLADAIERCLDGMDRVRMAERCIERFEADYTHREVAARVHGALAAFLTRGARAA
ncbi:MAG: glycosyltransferase [Pseudomonadales bacterium]|jgi:glycosyltransferase involved in cell wall biosynthesis|nr:glycosyltransferase [Pseudomonadales bacterium]